MVIDHQFLPSGSALSLFYLAGSFFHLAIVFQCGCLGDGRHTSGCIYLEPAVSLALRTMTRRIPMGAGFLIKHIQASTHSFIHWKRFCPSLSWESVITGVQTPIVAANCLLCGKRC